MGYRMLSRHHAPSEKRNKAANDESNSNFVCCKPDSTSCACHASPDAAGENMALSFYKPDKVLILHGSMKGTSKHFAEELSRSISHADTQVHCLSGYDAEAILSLPRDTILLIVISTYENGTPPLPAHLFVSSLEEAAHDFRVGKTALEGLRYSVFGCGNSLYETNFNTVAKKVAEHLGRDLGAKLLTPVELGDEDSGRLLDQFKVSLILIKSSPT